MNPFAIRSLLTRDGNDFSDLQIVGWWETRRIAFNLLVGAAGIFTSVVALVAGLIVEAFGKEAFLPDPPLFAVFGVFLYGIAANICYTGGWICELVARRIWRSEAAAFGRISFAFGLFGSITLTLLPAVLLTVLSIIRVASRSAMIQ